MKRLHFTTVQQKVLVSMLLCIMIPFCSLSAFVIYQTSSAKKADENSARVQIQVNMYNNIKGEFSYFDRAAYMLYGNYQMLEEIDNTGRLNYYSSRNAILDIYNVYTASSGRNNLLNINMYNKNNDLLAYFLYYRPATLKGDNQKNYFPYTEEVRQTGDTGKFFYLTYDSIFEMEVARYYYPILFKGKYIGFLEFTVDARAFQNSIQNYNQFYKGRVFILSENKQIVFDSAGILNGSSYDKKLLMQKHVIAKPLDDLHGILLYTYSERPSTQYSLLATGVVLLVSVLIIFFVSYLFSKRITNPIVLLADSMKKVESGSYGAQVEIQSNDEIGWLARIYNKMTKTIQYLIEHEIKSELEYKDAQISTLQAQISPHFLHNTLQAIVNMAQENSVNEISSICMALSEMYRYNMHISNKFATLDDEIMNVRNYMLIISKRYGNSIQFKGRLPSGYMDYLVPKLILQPIVENAVEHGLLPAHCAEKKLDIAFEKDETRRLLQIFVRNNGYCADAETVKQVNLSLSNGTQNVCGKQSESIGLNNVQKRIQLLCGEKYGMRFESNMETGTCVTYTLPLLKEG